MKTSTSLMAMGRIGWVFLGAMLLLPPAAVGLSGAGGSTAPDNGSDDDGRGIAPGRERYGFVVPGDAQYGFQNLAPYQYGPKYGDPDQKDMLALVARGNVIIGDYRSTKFQTQVPSLINGDIDSVNPIKPYVTTEADKVIGYGKGVASSTLCPRTPCFSGDYTKVDGGKKTDGTNRTFYESSLSDTDWDAYAVDKANDPMYQGSGAGKVAHIEAVLYSNHLVAGYVDTENFLMNGMMAARDDGLAFTGRMLLSHDRRLVANNVVDLALPGTFARPTPVLWVECPPAGCPD